MPKHHTYIATCIKEAPLQWGMELEALDNPVPSKIVRFPNLTQPLNTAPYFQSNCDPIAYFQATGQRYAGDASRISTPGFSDRFKDKWINWKSGSVATSRFHTLIAGAVSAPISITWSLSRPRSVNPTMTARMGLNLKMQDCLPLHQV